MGIFALLDDECKVPEPNVENFTYKLRTIWNEDMNVKNPKSCVIDWHVDWSRTSKNSFIIRHFSGDVKYSTMRNRF